MNVIKRNGEKEDVSFDKVLNRLKKLSLGLDGVNPVEVAQQICTRIYDGVATSELDELAAQLCSSMIVEHPDYGTLAARLAVSNHQKLTTPSFSECVETLWNNVDKYGDQIPLVSKTLYETTLKNKDKLNSHIDYERDYLLDYFGFKTLEKSYLLKLTGSNRIVERPQHMWMRVALCIHDSDIKDALETYDLMSKKFFTHATPTLFNAGTPRPQLSSCFLHAVKEDSVSGIFETLSDCAQISKYSGGIGLHVSNVRCRNSRIKGTNGISDGIVPMLRVYNNTARYINQSSKRNGSIAIYLEPWHGDIEAFLDLRKNTGAEEDRCRDLFLALWVPDLFMQRVENDQNWTLMCPNTCPGLQDAYGDAFETLYQGYEQEGKGIKTIRAQDLWRKIIESQIETGTPYILYKDASNIKSNQKNLGTIKSSNLCAEIIQYSSPDETAVCNLASISLPAFVDRSKRTFDHVELHRVTQVVTKNLNKIIDLNFYPIASTKKSNFRHRPIGIGIQGLADVFALLRIPFESEEANVLNRHIFETIYHGALSASMIIARTRASIVLNIKAGRHIRSSSSEYDLKYNDFETEEWIMSDNNKFPGAYVSFDGSPASKGILQFDMWGEDAKPTLDLWDWETLTRDIKTSGLRNSLLVAPMPTASTAQILGNNESFEPYTANIFKRKTLSGEFIVVNRHLLADLVSRNLWSSQMKEMLIAADGSVQNIPNIPEDLKRLYKTVWEIKQKTLINLAAERGPYIDQSQSMNVFIEEPDYKKLTSMHFYGWRRGLKCGCYYLRT